jgi:putative ABC transport system permease protein
MPDAPFSLRLYRRLLRLFPAGFRENYAQLMEREFRDELGETSNAFAVASLWLRLIADLAISIPAQLAREAAQDARHAVRLWARRPWHTAFAILALAIGIGANTGVFSVVNALLLRGLPFRNPERLVALHLFFAPHDTAQEFHNWRSHSDYLADTALFEYQDVNLGGLSEPRRVRAAQASSNFFSLLGAQPVLGRTFAPDEDAPGRNGVAVIGYGLWQQLYAGDPRVLGSILRMDGAALTIVGVAPPGFDYPRNAVLWQPARFSRGNNGWETVARLKDGISWPQAREAFRVEADRLWPTRRNSRLVTESPAMIPLRDELAGPVKQASLMLMACVALILLLACTNVANLLIARTNDRAAELSIRSALGASSARLTQQVLTECLLLSLAAATAGLALAGWSASLAAKFQPAPLMTQGYTILDARVLGFTAAVSIVSAIAFGIIPSWYAGRLHAFAARYAAGGRGSRLLREALAAGQIAITLILLTASNTVGRAFLHLMQIDRGFDTSGLVTVSVSLEGTTHDREDRRLAYFEEALARVRRLPGVRSASATEFLPLYATTFMGGPYQLDGRPASQNAMHVRVLAGYFQTMGARLLAGREFTPAEVRSNAPVAVVNDLFAREFGNPADILGRRAHIGRNAGRTVIGVVQHMDYMTEGANSLQVFAPSTSPGSFFSTIVARVNGSAEDRLAMIRDAIRSVDPQVPVFGVKTMRQRLDDALARPRFFGTAVGIFAAFAILLAVIGIYGIVSYAVGQRTHEMGIRMALGSTPSHLRVGLLRQNMLTIAAGVFPGMVGAVLAGRFLENLVEGAKSISAAACAASVLAIVAIAAAGIWTATRPIARLDVMDILRAE